MNSSKRWWSQFGHTTAEAAALLHCTRRNLYRITPDETYLDVLKNDFIAPPWCYNPLPSWPKCDGPRWVRTCYKRGCPDPRSLHLPSINPQLLRQSHTKTGGQHAPSRTTMGSRAAELAIEPPYPYRDDEALTDRDGNLIIDAMSVVHQHHGFALAESCALYRGPYFHSLADIRANTDAHIPASWRTQARIRPGRRARHAKPWWEFIPPLPYWQARPTTEALQAEHRTTTPLGEPARLVANWRAMILEIALRPVTSTVAWHGDELLKRYLQAWAPDSTAMRTLARLLRSQSFASVRNRVQSLGRPRIREALLRSVAPLDERGRYWIEAVLPEHAALVDEALERIYDLPTRENDDA